jgi:ABC-type multidrug transport system ATPase subunit
VTHRALLVDGLSVAANLALPLTLSVDPMPPETRSAVEAIAAEVGLASVRLEASTGTLSPLERVLLHLGRAVAHGPDLLILEDPTAGLRDDHASKEVGQALRRVAAAHRTGWLALTNDDSFVDATGGARLHLDVTTGRMSRPSRWRTLWRR